MQLKLRVVGGKNDGREIAVPGERFIVGRGEGCHLQPASEMVSRRHCEISVENGRFLIVDLGSSNGTLINGKRIDTTTELHSGDRLQIGPLKFLVVCRQSVAVPEPTSTVELASKEPKLIDPESEIVDWLTDGAGVTPQVSTVEMVLDETHATLSQPQTNQAGPSPGASASASRLLPVPPTASDPKDAREAASAAIGNVRDSIARNRQRQ